ncbi:helix-turn-helix domain-containing protein [Nonomuraea sp. NPDC052129]|uniref:TetR/AcrR family transcriptional regulator n=1 Tax=Nonomuraea sp. NPDC052129 TaxID=3154651 RepID=UPI00341C50A4
MREDGPPTMRRDAARNRDRLLSAARQVFAEHGHDVALEEVARVAGVSRTTIYRNFATREELVATVFDDNAAQIERYAAELREVPDGVVKLLDFVLDMQVENRGLAQVLAGVDMQWFTDLYSRIAASFEPLLERGRTAGIVHPVIDIEDLMLAISMGESVVASDDLVRREGRIRRVRGMLHRALFTR